MPQSCYFVVESLFIDALIVCAGEVGVKLFVMSWSFLMHYFYLCVLFTLYVIFHNDLAHCHDIHRRLLTMIMHHRQLMLFD